VNVRYELICIRDDHRARTQAFAADWIDPAVLNAGDGRNTTKHSRWHGSMRCRLRAGGRAASRRQRNGPRKLLPIVLSKWSLVMSIALPGSATIPALFTRALIGPIVWATVLNNRWTLSLRGNVGLDRFRGPALGVDLRNYGRGRAIIGPIVDDDKVALAPPGGRSACRCHGFHRSPQGLVVRRLFLRKRIRRRLSQARLRSLPGASMNDGPLVILTHTIASRLPGCEGMLDASEVSRVLSAMHRSITREGAGDELACSTSR
jgi:hypothetical protein